MSPTLTGLLAVDDELAACILSAWEWLLKKPCSILGLSKFGDLFLIDEEGVIDTLDVVRGEVKQVAYCVEELEFDLQSESIREQLLMDRLAKRIADCGMILQTGQCYAFVTPPMLGGNLAVENVQPWDIQKYHVGLSKLYRQVLDLPPGTAVIPR